MRTLRLVAYGQPDLRTAYTVALTAAHSICTCAQTSSRIHPCVKAAAHLPCARPPDGAYRLEYQGQLPKEHLLLLDLRRPFGAHILSRPRGRPLHGGLSRSSSATPATPCATVDPSPHRSPDPSLDAADGASVQPTPPHPARLFATPSD